MAEPAERRVEHDRSMSPMARFAAADPQVTGFPQDIVQSLQGLERRLGALEGRLGSAPASNVGAVVAAPAPALGTDQSGKKKAKKKKKSEAAVERQLLVTPRPPKAATPKVAVPPTRSRAGPLGPDVNTPREATSRRKGAKTPKRKASTPGAAELTPAKAAPRADKAEVSSKKKKGKGVGAETPTPARSGTAARARPTGTPAKPASTMRPVGQQAGGRKTAGGKAANPKGAGAGVPPLNQPPGKSRRKRAAIRKRLPRTSAVGLTVASVDGREAPTMGDIMRRAREAIPDYKVYGIKWIKPKPMTTGGLLLEIPGADSA